ncbi:peptidoglycan-binding domain-containing protein [Polycladidibacter hongkongensis]|uniref:peptidoglycan-binding domain-containing protein n=1 Tax=Polycladidibacter hongkongensis TaxID=1647556 RepID=UPI00082EBFD7|nr:peptidoglycan-binding protein [Pseudovibrio hongkongensis]
MARTSPKRHQVQSKTQASGKKHSALKAGICRLPVLATAVLLVMIMLNALAFQEDQHPAPMFTTRAPSQDEALAKAAAAEATQLAALQVALVRDVQLELRRLGHYNGSVDGNAGNATRGAVMAFERRSGLRETGKVTTALLAQLTMAATPKNRGSEQRANQNSAPLERNTAGLPASQGTEPQITGSINATPAQAPPTPMRKKPVTASATPHSPSRRSGDQVAVFDTARIMRLQAALAQSGYGPITVDGVAGQQTSDALRRFAQDRGLVSNGEISPRVLQELERFIGRKI